MAEDIVHRWLGTVLEVHDTWFLAKLRQPGVEALQEAAWIKRDVVPKSDEALLVEGAVFYWTIGYVTIPGKHRPFSKIRFRRSNWTEAELTKLSEPSDIDALFVT